MAEYLPVERVDHDNLSALLVRTAQHDRDEVLSEHKAIRVRGSDDSRAVAVVTGDELWGYCQAAWHRPARPEEEGHWGVEVVLDPEARSGDAVAGCVRAIRKLLPPRDVVAVWSSFDYIGDGLELAGYVAVRQLLRMRRPLPAAGPAKYPPGVELRSFDPEADCDAWLAVNNSAFAGHPENGALGRADLAERLALPWFDEEGFLLAWEGERLVGSCWTKVHSHGSGEIYIIGVRPAARGRGLGRALLTSGMEYLHRRRGADSVLLHVEGDNLEAISLYESAGFAVERVSRQYVLPADR